MGLISIILFIMGVVGFFIFGFMQVVCGKLFFCLCVNEVGVGYMIFYGFVYDFVFFYYFFVEGIFCCFDGNGVNVFFDFFEKYGGKDGSFLF